MYGLKKAGKLSQDRLLYHLASHTVFTKPPPPVSSVTSPATSPLRWWLMALGSNTTTAQTLISLYQLFLSSTMPKPTLSQPNFLASPITTTAPSKLYPSLTLAIFPFSSPAFAPTGSILSLLHPSTLPPPMAPGLPSPPLDLTFFPHPIRGITGRSRLHPLLQAQLGRSHPHHYLRPRR